jgi:heme/copper-type cytochrome/quinol oxidase subunit 2
MQWFRTRFEFFREHTLVKWLLAGWALISIYDTGGSQLLPTEWAQKRPTVYQVLSMSTGWLSWDGWLVVGAAMIALFAVEYGARQKPSHTDRAHSNGNQMSISHIGMIICAIGFVTFFFANQQAAKNLELSNPDEAKPDQFKKNVAGLPIEWRFDKPVTILFYSRKPGQAVWIEGIQIHATNKSDFALKNVKANIVADMKTDLMSMRVNPHGTILGPTDSATLIPPRADFDLFVEIGPRGMAAEQFMHDYGTLHFAFAFDENNSHNTFNETFSLSYIEDQIAFIEANTKADRLSRAVPDPVPSVPSYAYNLKFGPTGFAYLKAEEGLPFMNVGVIVFAQKPY